MSTYYLLDMHVPSIADSRIVDVVKTDTTTSEFRCDGLTPIRVPDGVRVVNPVSLTDLLTQKYQSLHARYPGFQYILSDDLLDPSGVQVGPPPTWLRKSGYRGTIGGHFRTLAVTASITVTQCIVIYETFTWRYVDARDGRVERYYIEEPEGLRSAQISVNNGSSFTTTTSGALVTIPALDQGTDVIIEFLSSGDFYQDNRLVHIGSWAVIL